LPSDRTKKFRLVLIKPSHYDDDGYVIQWLRSSIPSNTMAAIYGLARDCIDRDVLGPDVEIEIEAIDETNTRVDVEAIAGRINAMGGRGLVALVGVQTNQFPRAVDLAVHFGELGVQTSIGGFHVSGCLAMLPDVPADLQAAMDAGVSLFAGELEGRLDRLLRDAYEGRLEPLYNYTAELPNLEGQPSPYLPADVVGRMTETRASFDAGRGCPFTCSFCTIINVQGRESRHRTPDDIERIVRANVAQGIHKFFITDDNFARNTGWEPIFDRLIELRGELGVDLKLTVQVDTLCHKIPNFIEKAGEAGVEKVFIGLENINPEALQGSGKTQNKITEYRRMLQAWHDADVLTLAGYILGFPTDTRESILRDIRIIQREIPIDVLEFFILVPLPGSQDHKELLEKGVPMDPDMNNYDSVHVIASHEKMTDREWIDVYHEAWEAYYTPEHIERVMSRAAKWGSRINKARWIMLTYHMTSRVEKVHPLDGGLFRRKHRLDRRPGLPVESPWVFYPRYWWETARKTAAILNLLLRYEAVYRRVSAGRAADAGPDAAMDPMTGDDYEALELYNATSAARDVASKAKRTEHLRATRTAA
jgi:hypothetical protein